MCLSVFLAQLVGIYLVIVSLATLARHRQFKKIVNNRLYKVTLDCHRGEVSARNVISMSKQAGVSKTEFYEAAKG